MDLPAELERIVDWARHYPIKPYPPLIINAAITGMLPTAKDSPHVPLSVEQIASEAQAVADAGASILHLHARDSSGQPSVEPEIYHQIIRAVRGVRPELIVCVSCSGRVHPQFELRERVLRLEGDVKPEMASLTLGSLNFPKQASINDPDTISQLAQTMRDRSIKPELEVFEAGMIDFAAHLVKRGLLTHCPLYFNLLLGSRGSSSGDVPSLVHMVSRLPPDSVWAATGIGRFQLGINVAAMVMGGHVRVGLEDNLYYDNAQTQLASNTQLIERVVRIAGELGRRVAKPGEARAMLNLD